MTSPTVDLCFPIFEVLHIYIIELRTYSHGLEESLINGHPTEKLLQKLNQVIHAARDQLAKTPDFQMMGRQAYEHSATVSNLREALCLAIKMEAEAIQSQARCEEQIRTNRK